MSVPADPGSPPRSPQDHRAGDVRRPVRRHSAPPTGPKDVDWHARIPFLVSMGGAFAGAVVGVIFWLLGQWGAGMIVVLALGAGAPFFVVPFVVLNLGGGSARVFFAPSGASTPRKREYSHAESLVARGLYEEAVVAFEVAVAEDASDPTPYLRIARVYRDRMERYEDAAQWFKRTLAESDAHGGLALLTTKELVELYTEKLADPPRAAPLLARMAEEREGTPEGAWAAEELARIKTFIAGEERLQ